MKDRYRLVLRNTIFYAHNRQTGQRVSLETTSREKAKRLLLAKNEAHTQPLLNTAIAKVYLTVQDPVLVQRTWQQVMDSYATRGKDSTRERVQRELTRKIFNSIRGLRLVETTVSHFETVLTEGSASTSNYLRRLHNLAVRRGWLLQPLMSPADWPVATPQPRRAVTAEEHARIMATENDPERRRYYQMLWETGGAQSDVAELTWDNVDRAKNVLVYHRKKTGEKCQLKIGPTLCDLMSHL
jgi:integrase